MIEEEIRKYILEGKWENQYPSAIEYLIEEIKRLRGIAKTCLEAIEAGGDIRNGTIMLIEQNLKLMEMKE